MIGLWVYAAAIATTAVSFRYFPNWWVGTPGVGEQAVSDHAWNILVTYCTVVTQSSHVVLVAVPTIYCAAKLYHLYFVKNVVDSALVPPIENTIMNTVNTELSTVAENVVTKVVPSVMEHMVSSSYAFSIFQLIV